MTMCPNSKGACECQPQDGVMCPHGPTPAWKLWAPESEYKAKPPAAGVMAVPANCRQCGRQLRLDGLCVECDYSVGVAPSDGPSFTDAMKHRAIQVWARDGRESVERWHTYENPEAALRDMVNVPGRTYRIVPASGVTVGDGLDRAKFLTDMGHNVEQRNAGVVKVPASELEPGKKALTAAAYEPVLKNLAPPDSFHPQFVSGFWHGHALGRERGKVAAGVEKVEESNLPGGVQAPNGTDTGPGALASAWADLPDELRCHPGVKRLYRIATAGGKVPDHQTVDWDAVDDKLQRILSDCTRARATIDMRVSDIRHILRKVSSK